MQIFCSQIHNYTFNILPLQIIGINIYKKFIKNNEKTSSGFYFVDQLWIVTWAPIKNFTGGGGGQKF